MKGAIEFVRNLIRFHKGKAVLALLFALIFGVLMFPYDDLGDLITTKISDATGGAWYIQFDRMGLGLFPPGVKTENVSIESSALPTINADSLELTPWIMGAITAKTGLKVDASGLFKGNLSLDYREGEKLKSGERAKDVVVRAESLSLPLLTDFLRSGGILNMALQGSLGLDSALNIDPVFDRQPSGDLGLQIAGLQLPSQSFNTQMGPVQTPSLKLGKVALQAKMGDGKLNIEDLSFGGPNEDMTGKIKGELGIAIRRDAGGVRPQVGAYDLRIDMTVKKSFIDTGSKTGAGLAFMLIEKFKQETPQGVRYAFRVKATSPAMPPEFLPPQ
jgi:type II secretion system protein N